MKTSIEIFSYMLAKVRFFSKQLNLKISKNTGRPLAITPEETIALSLFKQAQGIETKKSLWEIFAPKCSYKTLVVNMNRLFLHAALVLKSILRWNQKDA